MWGGRLLVEEMRPQNSCAIPDHVMKLPIVAWSNFYSNDWRLYWKEEFDTIRSAQFAIDSWILRTVSQLQPEYADISFSNVARRVRYVELSRSSIDGVPTLVFIELWRNLV